MIRKLFILNLIFFYILSYSQVLTYVGNNALVTIQSQTLVYNGGGLQLAGTGTINNSGNIMIVKNAATADVVNIASTSGLNLKFNGSTSYGQLYIKDIAQANITGKVNKEYRADANTGSDATFAARQQIGLPFFEYKVQDMINNITNSTNNTGGNYLNLVDGGTARFRTNSVFKWNNARARFDQILSYSDQFATTNVGSSLDYYIIPRRNVSGTIVWSPAGATGLTTFTGTPVSDVTTVQALSLTGASAGINFGYNGSARNTYNERYDSYLDDPFQSKTANAGGWDVLYAKNLYQVANPFLTNIDLRYIGLGETTNSDGNNIPNLQGIAYYTSGLTWVRGTGTSYPVTGTSTGQTVRMTTSSGAFQAGDLSANRLIVKPMSEFMIKLSADNGNNPASRIDFTSLRRFSSSSRDNTTQTTNPTSKIYSDNIDIPADKIVKQLAVILYDKDSIEVGRTYYAVSPTSLSGNNPGNTLLQSYNGDDSYIYTKEEKSSGGEDINLSGKLYINEANEVDFKSKEIPLYINYSEYPYYLNFEVYEKGDRVVNGLSTGKNFYIKNDQGQFVKIEDGDSLSLSGTKILGLYYELPEGATLGTDNTISNSQTIIAKKESQWVVRFARDWNNATVEVFSASGQLLNSKSKIITTADYKIPLNYQVKGMFLVRAISDKGEIVTKKILN
ncbi:MAG: hypothetical protein DI529_05450 [Chryseobacterium sp.]|nr:MAG: hypothetical protein DI529_05450 [Chryseobacterium sp.]